MQDMPRLSLRRAIRQTVTNALSCHRLHDRASHIVSKTVESYRSRFILRLVGRSLIDYLGRMALVDVERTYLELLFPGALRRAESPGDRFSLRLESPCSVETYRWFYAEVGRAYFWSDRLRWSDGALEQHLRHPDVCLWIVRESEVPAGFFELMRHEDGSVEIAYFGLLAPFHGRGWGKFLLTRAVDEAWAHGANRVWLHTCTLDGPTALPNYVARGFQPFRSEHFQEEIPDPIA